MSRRRTKAEWMRVRRLKRMLLASAFILIAITVAGLIYEAKAAKRGEGDGLLAYFFHTEKVDEVPITEMYLTPNEYSRPQIALEKVKGIVVHYTANPGTSAEANRNYFEGLKDSEETYASSHFVIGIDGEIVQCIPLDEISYASNERNYDTISIECCHEDESGEFSQETYDSLVSLTAWLCGKYNLKKKDIIRHYDVTGKLCPKYYVEHEDMWLQFKEDVFLYIQENND